MERCLPITFHYIVKQNHTLTLNTIAILTLSFTLNLTLNVTLTQNPNPNLKFNPNPKVYDWWISFLPTNVINFVINDNEFEILFIR